MPESGDAQRWWGTYPLSLGTSGRWRIGPLTVWAQRLVGEWRLARQTGTDPLDGRLEIEVPAAVADFLALDDVHRFGVAGAADILTLEAALADRPVVARPEKPFHVPPGESITTYVGSPLWLRIGVGTPPLTLWEWPTFRPSDTWLGPTTLEGELCYASRTVWRVQLDDIPRLPHRAVTAVRIENRARSTLSIERLKLPAPNLALYTSDDGTLWTQDVVYERTKGNDFAALRLRDRPPQALRDAKLLTPPRQPRAEHGVVRAFHSLFD